MCATDVTRKLLRCVAQPLSEQYDRSTRVTFVFMSDDTIAEGKAGRKSEAAAADGFLIAKCSRGCSKHGVCSKQRVQLDNA